jgi:CRISPR system Cascade subunit CasB
MTAATASSPPGHPRSRRLGQLGTALDWRLDRLQAEYLHGSPRARTWPGCVAHSASPPAACPRSGSTVGAVPESLRWDRDEPSRAEQAAHSALTLFAMHQQSMPVPAHVHDVSLGRAVGQLAVGGEQSADAVTRRFMAVATATSVDEALVHIRGLVAQLRSAQRGFDYARLADDLVGLLNPERAEKVRLAWGRDFYRTRPVSTDNPETHDTTEETSAP